MLKSDNSPIGYKLKITFWFFNILVIIDLATIQKKNKESKHIF